MPEGKLCRVSYDKNAKVMKIFKMPTRPGNFCFSFDVVALIENKEPNQCYGPPVSSFFHWCDCLDGQCHDIFSS